ncbi:unnamed protein product [Tilletia controversa]|nr:unnamed protein product [Tilletia controversa]
MMELLSSMLWLISAICTTIPTAAMTGLRRGRLSACARLWRLSLLLLVLLCVCAPAASSTRLHTDSLVASDGVLDGVQRPLLSPGPEQQQLDDGGADGGDGGSGPTSFNLIDLLARSAHHTIFVRLLQRARLVPTLNNLMQFGDGRGLTILAPINQAFLRSSDRQTWLQLAGIQDEDLRDDGSYSLLDADRSSSDVNSGSNSNELLRQRLFYHILNYTIPYSNASAATLPVRPALHPTLHFPSRHLFDPEKPTDPTRPGPVPHPPAPPFLPGLDPDALLGNQGQVLRVSAANVSDLDNARAAGAKPGASHPALVFGSDHLGKGGVVAVAEDCSSTSGVVISVNGILSLPPKLEDIIHSHPSLSSLSTLFPPTTLHSLSFTPHLTLFAPASPAFLANLSTVEHSYLFDHRWTQAKGDRFKLLGWHSVSQGVDKQVKEGVVYADDIRRQGRNTLSTILGGRIEVVADPASGNLSIGASHLLEEDIIIENGVIHIISNLLLPYPELGLALTVEKTLLGLNASKFVDLMYKTELEDYLTSPVGPFGLLPDSNSPQTETANRSEDAFTFVVPRDDFLDASVLRNELPSDKKKLQDVLRYHIAPGALVPESLSNGMLVGTELRNWRLKDGRQRVTVSVGEEDSTLRKGNGDVSFGGVNVVSDPVKVGPSLIYLTPAFLTPPTNPIQTAVSSLELSTFVAAVFSAHLDGGLKRAPGVTYLIPSNSAFENLGLVMPYLLSGNKPELGKSLGADLNALESGDAVTPRDELRSLVEFHAIDSIVYLQDFPTPSKANKSAGSGNAIAIAWTRYPTLLDGAAIWAGRDANGTVRIRRTDPSLATGGADQLSVRSALLGPDDRNDAVLKKADMLTNTGVIHEISRVEMPETLDITIGKLMLGAKAGTMTDLVRKAGYGWILNGSTPTTAQVDELFQVENEAHTSKKMPKKRRKKEERRHKRRHDMFRDEKQAYILLTPLDTAFSRINLTRYVSDRQALKRLIQLHIVPLTPEAAGKVAEMNEANYGGRLLPLALDDHLALPSLLDRRLGGASSYGSVAFRRVLATTAGGAGEDGSTGGGGGGDGGGGAGEEPNLGWMVGVRGTRGSVDGKRHVAKVVGFGRENLGLVRRGTKQISLNGGGGSELTPHPSLRVAGGVLTIDTVIEEYHPSWWYVWGWVVALCVGMSAVLALIGFGIWRFRARDGKIRLPDALDGEED